MDQSAEAKMWKRGFAAGFLALVLSVGGQVTHGSGMDEGSAWPVRAEPGLAELVVQHLKPVVRSHGVAQRVVLAVLGAVLHSSCG